MGLALRLLRPSAQSSAPKPTDDFWYEPVPMSTGSGVDLDEVRALEADAVYDCIKIISETIAALPRRIYRRKRQGGKEVALDHPLHKLLGVRPNPWQTSFEFIEMMTANAVFRSNAYAHITYRGGDIHQLVPLRRGRIKVEQLESLRLRYRYSNAGGKEQVYTQDEILHLRGWTLNGLTGLDLLQLKREAIGLSLAAETFGANYLKNGASLSGVLEHSGKLSPQAHANLRRSFMEQYTGSTNAGAVLIAEEGMKWKQMGNSARDAQLLETRKFARAVIAAFFRIPPHKVGLMDQSTFSNIEHQAIEFVVDTITPHVTRWEQKINADLLDGGEDYYFKFILDGLLRGDAKSRFEAYHQGISGGFLLRNEARELEDRDPIEGLDQPLQPLNMATVDQAAELQGDQGKAVPRKEPEDDTDNEEARSSVKAFQILIGDAAARLSAAEIRLIEKRADRADEDRDRFDAWLHEMYSDHRVFVVKTLAPIGLAWKSLTTKDPSLNAIADRISTAGLKALLGTSVKNVLQEWEHRRALDISMFISEEFGI